MSGTIEGGRKAVLTNKTRHGDDFYVRIGGIGGKAKVKKGFAANPELAKRVGAIGGANSRRGKAVK